MKYYIFLIALIASGNICAQHVTHYTIDLSINNQTKTTAVVKPKFKAEIKRFEISLMRYQNTKRTT